LPHRLLIVDDSPTVREQVGIALRQAGFETVEATDGHDGLMKLAQDRRIAMVILDVDMPGMNGLDMLEAMRNDARLDRVHVIMLTSEGARSLIQRARAAGARGWIVKPFKATILADSVRKILSEQRAI
jgi:two-component system, chemotaxis family, chemotaxis protein CheY